MHYVGIDVSKQTLDVYDQGQHQCCLNHPKAIEKLLKKLNPSSIVVFEATGGYERLLRNKIEDHRLNYHMAHPNKVRAFAKAKGLLAKTDKIDAQLIAEYAQTMNPELSVSRKHTKLQELLKRRLQLIEDKKRESHRLDKEYDPVIVQSIKKHIGWIEKEIKMIEKHLDQEKEQPDIQEKLALLTSIPCIGDITALSIWAYMPEIEEASPKQLAALAGLAPLNRDSGQFRGKRFIQAGRSHLRKSLYMSALPAIRFHPELRAFYKRLREKGKSAKVALVALMRKLLTMAASVLRRKTPWQDVLQSTVAT